MPDRVEQLGLAVVDMAHDGDHRRACREIPLIALVLTELDVERLEQLPVLFLRGDHLHVVAEFRAEQLQRLVIHRLGRGDHLAEMEEHLHERGRVHPYLVGEVTQRRPPRQPDDLAIPARDLDAADGRRLHVVEFLAALLPRLPAARGASARPPEGALRAAPAAPAAAWPSAAAHASRTRATAGTATGATAARSAAGTATATRPGTSASARTATLATAARSAAGTATARTAAGTATAGSRSWWHAARAWTRTTRTLHVRGTGAPCR